MVRKTALVTAMLGAFASQAFAMGLGEIRLNSVLNQPLHAEIELLSPTANDLAELRVALASSEAYARAGVERVFFHTKLRFEVVKRPNGGAVIEVTSRDPVREPYLDFLVEATWGAGQVLREYTVLVDPPALMPAPRPEVAAPVTESMPTETAYAPSVERVAGGVAGGLVDGQYHTQPSDTLWSIATAVRPDASVSMEQVMLGLLKANPDAFIGGNINNLKAGQILRVPSREEMTALSQNDALNEVRQQNTAWREGRATAVAPPAAAPAPEAAEPAAAPAAQPAAPAAQPAAEAQTDAQLKLLAPETGAAKTAAGTGTGQSVDELRKELTLAVEAVEAQKLENQELNARLKQLEDQIAQLHRLIELKNTEMAQLGAAVTPGTSGATAPQESAAAQPATAEPVPGETAAGATPPADAAAAPTAEAPTETAAPATEQPAEDAAPAEQASAEEQPAPAAAATAPAEPATPPAPAAEAPAEDTGLLATLLANPMLKWGAAGAAALVALLAWMGARRRRMQDTDFQESILADRKPSAAPAPSAAAVAVAAAAAAKSAPSAASEPKAEAPTRDAVQSDSSLFTDFAVSDMGALQNDAEADPVAEADVYLAYGRYQQAEELIRTALDRTPQRNDLRFKLLEVLYAAKNVGGFDTEAEALLAALGNQDDETWQRVKEMGQELNPGNPLYRSGSAAASAAPAVAAAAAMGGAAVADNSLDFELGNADSGLDFTPAAARADDNSLDFDMGELASFAPAEETASLSLPVEEDFSFDLGTAVEAEDEADGTLASSDEVATKLDLARAYIEMGDPEGARSILDEVMQEGNGAQKSEAQSLMSQIG